MYVYVHMNVCMGGCQSAKFIYAISSLTNRETNQFTCFLKFIMSWRYYQRQWKKAGVTFKRKLLLHIVFSFHLGENVFFFSFFLFLFVLELFSFFIWVKISYKFFSF